MGMPAWLLMELRVSTLLLLCVVVAAGRVGVYCIHDFTKFASAALPARDSI